MRCRMRTARPSTILISSWPASWAMEKPKPARLPLLAFEQISQSRPRRRRAADSAFERLQDCQSDTLPRISHEELESLFIGYGYKPYFVEGSDPELMHQSMATTLDTRLQRFKRFRTGAPPQRQRARLTSMMADDHSADPQRMDGAEGSRRQETEGSWRSHQVPLAEMASKPDISSCSKPG